MGLLQVVGLVILLAPIVATLVLSFSATLTFPPSDFSLDWYRNFLSRSEFIDGLRTSLLLAVSTTLVSTVIGAGMAVVMARRAFAGRGVLNGLILSPLTAPRVAIGVALLLFFVSVNAPGALFRLFVLHLIITCPYVVGAVTASLQGEDPTLEQAAMNLGATPLQAFMRVTLPLIRPGIVAGAIFSFVVSFDEVTASTFLTDARTTTFPVMIFSYLARGSLDPTVAAASSFMLVFVVAIVLVLARYVGLGRALGIRRQG